MTRFSLNSLRSQLFLWISLPVLVVLLTFALAGVQEHGQAMHDLVQTRADGLAQATAALISVRIDQEQDLLVRHSALPALHAEPLDAAAVSVALAPLQNEFVAGVALYAADSRVASQGFERWFADPTVSAVIREVVTTGLPTLRTLHTDEEWFLIHITPVPTLHAGSVRTLIGIVPLSVLALNDLVRSVASEETTHISLLGTSGESLFITTPSIAADANAVSAQAVVPTTGWTLILRQSWDEWIPPVLRFSNVLLFVVAAAVAISVLSAYFGLRQIIYPLERLSRAVGALGSGDFNAVQESVGGVQEIEELQQALADMAQQVRRYQQELRGYIGAITLGQEEERKRLARELHDDTVQALIALNQQVEMAERHLEDDPAGASERLRELRPLINGTIGGIRRQIGNLRPLYLEDLGFVSALEMLVNQTAAQHGLTGDFQLTGEAQRPLPPAVETTGYRIVQEALQNIVNHARASWVHVELIFAADAITLRIEDDGVGFATPDHLQQLALAGHYGLLGMQERARLHNGQVMIDSTPNEGTTIIVTLSTHETAVAA